MFRGNHPTRVDEKGRLKIPADYKREIDERYGSQFFITSLDGERAQVWPMPEWQKIEEKVVQLADGGSKKEVAGSHKLLRAGRRDGCAGTRFDSPGPA